MNLKFDFIFKIPVAYTLLHLHWHSNQHLGLQFSLIGLLVQNSQFPNFSLILLFLQAKNLYLNLCHPGVHI